MDSWIDDEAPVERALRDGLEGVSAPGALARRIAVALSGGRDSIVLLDALSRLAPCYPIALTAIHVHHGLSPHADRWASFCAAECTNRLVPFAVHRVRVERQGGRSLEATARSARYAVLTGTAADWVALAHHADDQAETLLLQLLRGAGPHGLSSMPRRRATNGGPVLWRPFLDIPRSAIDAYARSRSLTWVDDESNADIGVRRNFIRHEIAPRLAAAFPGYPATLNRSAAHQAEAALLLDDLARLDATECVADTPKGKTLDRAALVALDGRAPHRARNLLRWFLRMHALRPPSSARLAAMHEQLVRAADDARVRLVHGGVEIGIHRGQVVVHPAAIAPFALRWHGEARFALVHGVLEFAPSAHANVAGAMLDDAEVTIRTRVGGERIQLAKDRPRQALKRILQDVGMPLWERESLPLVFCGDALAVVPGIGIDVDYQARGDAKGYAVLWHPGVENR